MKTICWGIVVLIVASQSAASELTLVEKIAVPDSRISGLAWDADHLWISFEDNASVYQGMIVKMDMSGNIVGSFYAPGSDGIYDVPDVAGLAFDGTCLWSLNSLDDVIYRLTQNGQVVGSIPAPGRYCDSLTWDGASLWVTNTDNDKIYRINPSNGDIIHSINAPGWESGTSPNGVAWDGEALWVSNDYGEKIYRVDPQSGTILTAFNNSFSFGVADSLSWDGRNLWAGGDSSVIRKFTIAKVPEIYPNPTVEQVDLLPENYTGLVVYFDRVKFFPDISSRKITSFEQPIYGVTIGSPGGKLYSGYLDEDEINFYVGEDFATDIIYADLGSDLLYANLICEVERKTTFDGQKTYWMCEVLRIEIRGEEAEISSVLEETGILPPNPIEAAIAAERSRWDADGDGRIGLPEAIRALRVAGSVP
jgi:hypothetical protein